MGGSLQFFTTLSRDPAHRTGDFRERSTFNSGLTTQDRIALNMFHRGIFQYKRRAIHWPQVLSHCKDVISRLSGSLLEFASAQHVVGEQ